MRPNIKQSERNQAVHSPDVLVARELAEGWNAFKRRWTGCTNCEIGSKAHHTVLYRGYIPCDVLLIGEAPGASEDSIGAPFIGRSGKELSDIIEIARIEFYDRTTTRYTPANVDPHAREFTPLTDNPHTQIEEGYRFTYGITNTIACHPPGNRDPKTDEIENCKIRLEQLLRIAQPLCIVYVGDVAAKNTNWVEGYIDCEKQPPDRGASGRPRATNTATKKKKKTPPPNDGMYRSYPTTKIRHPSNILQDIENVQPALKRECAAYIISLLENVKTGLPEIFEV